MTNGAGWFPGAFGPPPPPPPPASGEGVSCAIPAAGRVPPQWRPQLTSQPMEQHGSRGLGISNGTNEVPAKYCDSSPVARPPFPTDTPIDGGTRLPDVMSRVKRTF